MKKYFNSPFDFFFSGHLEEEKDQERKENMKNKLKDEVDRRENSLFHPEWGKRRNY